MTEPDRIDEQDDKLTAEERQAWEKELEFRRSLLAFLLAHGMKWSETKKGELVHPDDPELNAWSDPYTEEILCSPKVGELLKREFLRIQGGA